MPQSQNWWYSVYKGTFIGNLMLSQTAEYALRAMVYLSMKGEAATGHEIALATKVPAGYLAKLMNLLVRSKLLKSQRGMGGGFVLAVPLEQISLLDVIDAVDPIEVIETCPLGIESHGCNLCPLHRRISKSISDVKQSLANEKLSELLRESKSPDCQSVPLTPRSSS